VANLVPIIKQTDVSTLAQTLAFGRESMATKIATSDIGWGIVSIPVDNTLAFGSTQLVPNLNVSIPVTNTNLFGTALLTPDVRVAMPVTNTLDFTSTLLVPNLKVSIPVTNTNLFGTALLTPEVINSAITAILIDNALAFNSTQLVPNLSLAIPIINTLVFGSSVLTPDVRNAIPVTNTLAFNSTQLVPNLSVAIPITNTLVFGSSVLTPLVYQVKTTGANFPFRPVFQRVVGGIYPWTYVPPSLTPGGEFASVTTNGIALDESRRILIRMRDFGLPTVDSVQVVGIRIRISARSTGLNSQYFKARLGYYVDGTDSFTTDSTTYGPDFFIARGSSFVEVAESGTPQSR